MQRQAKVFVKTFWGLADSMVLRVLYSAQVDVAPGCSVPFEASRAEADDQADGSFPQSAAKTAPCELLVRAAEDGDHAMVRTLLGRFADPDSREHRIHPRSLDLNARCALHYAAEYNHVEILKTLLAAHADPNATTSDGDQMTPLGYAALSNSPECARLLVEAGANPAQASTEGCNAADLARGDLQGWLLDLLEARFASEASSSRPDFFASQSLVRAAGEGKLDTVDRLLSIRADPNSHDGTHTALQRAVCARSYTMITRLLEAGASPHLPAPGAADNDASGLFALHLAAKVGPLDLVQMLIDADADPSQGSVPDGKLAVECVRLFGTQESSILQERLRPLTSAARPPAR